MIINEKRLIKIWCRLDNRARYLDELMVNKDISDDMFKVCYLEKDRLDLLLLELACACGFDSVDILRTHIKKHNLVFWNHNSERWIV